ncbi:Bug family tripartite tricarboxylate transporter substrate binding protein [Variovorax sp. PBL-E5]|uniref:Bug family tripartite tricarboxylate transporter substrate binding protein n=1 Tax=Variovorax sp. PBL-E5 TaxID=434014 RepID=UPI0013177386|nr:tripartite tricarboxylate transporter substrate binding protein [Variovorax sp. PBL-E5]VTU45113.1 Argininosuccinate lyase [Variovorax sp. PBL-E5]
MKKIVIGLAAVVLLTLSVAARAEWPDKPIRILVPFPSGNSSDVSMRLLGQKLSVRLGQPIVVENRVGAGGTVGTGQAAKAAPDGYTLAMGSTGPLAIARALRPDSLPYDTARDFMVVGAVAWAPQVLVVRKDLPIASFQEFLAYGRRPDVKLNYGSPGNGTTPHLVIAQLVNETRINAEHIPFQGGTQALTSLIGGQIDFISDNVPVVQGAIAGGRVRALAVTSGTRIPSMESVPTLKELGVKDFDLQGWILLIAPKGLPETISSKLIAAVEDVMKMPDVRQRLLELGLVPMDMPRARLPGFLQSEATKWAAVVKVSGAAESTR